MMMTLLRALLALFALLAGAAHAADDFLDPEIAFKHSVQVLDANTVQVRFDIAPGYYMYRERFAFADAGGAPITPEPLPAGKRKFDETFQKEVETYRDAVVIRLPLQAARSATLTLTAQGCADAGLCYPPMTREVRLDAGGAAAASSASVGQSGPATSARPNTAAPAAADEQGRIAAVFAERNLLTGMLVFFGLGLLLTFTPCVLPMVPILSSIITGQGTAVTKQRGAALAASYVLGMALVYTGIGVAAGLAGEGLAAFLQKPPVLAAFAGLLTLLALSMFGLYELQLPAALRDRLDGISQKQQGGRFAGVFVMGALSAVIVGPCVTAPLAGTLVYIAQTRDAVFGGAMLLAMALGMGVPLIAIGIGAGALLPRAGLWMENVKRFFGVLLIATALWMLNPVLPVWTQMLLWASLFILCGVWLSVLDPLPAQAGALARLGKGVGALCVLLGTVLAVGVASGGRDLLQPLAHLRSPAAAAPAPGATAQAAAPRSAGHGFKVVRTVGEYEAALQAARGQPVLVDVWAQWCTSCKEMESITFADAGVSAAMQGFTKIQIDVTDNTPDQRALLKRFGLFGPPAVLVHPRGEADTSRKLVGYVAPEPFGRFLAESVSRVN
ncbi:MAG TPA: protein-disulfide reductase DsbD [Burkholderiaceae bacterium]|nr:protein-disulfide reductase DsbD [Burkholderiaceae bacterium]